MRTFFTDPELQAQFARQGYVVVPLLDRQQVDATWGAFHALPCEITGSFHLTIASRDTQYRAAVQRLIDEVLVEPLARYVPGFQLCGYNMAVKEPSADDSYVEIHRDGGIVDESENVSVHVWCPLIDVDEQSGCLSVAEGSHRWFSQPRGHGDEYSYFPFRDVLPVIKRDYMRAIPLKAGEAILFDGRLLHASSPNRAPRRRVALCCVAAPQDAPLYCFHRTAPGQLALYQVTADYFWKIHDCHAQPTDRQPDRTVSIDDHAVTEAELIEEIARCRGELSPAGQT